MLWNLLLDSSYRQAVLSVWRGQFIFGCLEVPGLVPRLPLCRLEASKQSSVIAEITLVKTGSKSKIFFKWRHLSGVEYCRIKFKRAQQFKPKLSTFNIS